MTRRTSTASARSGISILIIILLLEKMVQHGFTALLFLVHIPGIGTPSIGERFSISAPVMALLNVAYFVLAAVALTRFAKRRPFARPLVAIVAGLDIVLEFLFHHFFFITVSVLVSTALLAALWFYCEPSHKERNP
jgi:hypothetical protein